MTDVDLYWSFRSPYSYLATPGAVALEQKYDVDIRLRPVLPLAVRDPGFFSPANAKRGRYIQLDWPRRAEMLGMRGSWPSPDPIVQDLETFEISPEQPHIFRLTHLGIEAERRGAGLRFAKEVSHVIFGGAKEWHVGNHLAEASGRAGLNLAEMEEAIASPSTHADEVIANQEALEAAGHWGVPTFVYNGEPFFGEDRIDTLAWRLERDRIPKRS
jgi:2-hydroxychromene-2-carboxylate isomerase